MSIKFTDALVRAYRSGYMKGYMEAMNDFERLAKLELPEEFASAWLMCGYLGSPRSTDEQAH